jgi:hypothetical protein
MSEENILDQMGITPFPDTDELDIDEREYQPPPTKTKTSVVLSAATRRQIDWLTAQGYGNQSEVIALAVYGMWRVEQG